MLFQSHVFLLAFLPLVVIGWFSLARSEGAREWFLIVASLIFYGWWDVRCLPILLGMGAVSWLAAKAHIRLRHQATGRAILVCAIALNLSVLAFFKYATFIAENITALVGLQAPPLSIVLPIGISFYTFELVSYLIDLGWRGAPPYGMRHFSLFVTFFPRLIAGPIVRHDEIIPQFKLDPLRDGASERFARGMLILALGLIEKVAIADQLAPIADAAFMPGAALPLISAWSGALAFTFQLFFDFAAYSQMAIGIALMLGITLPPNFESPYSATSLREFWRRWHMTLSRYLRDYVYIPLGGDRQSWRGYVVTTLVTMGLCGLWHGAGWLFVAWGLLHGVGLLVCRAWQKSGFALHPAVAWALTFVFVVVGWVLFRAPSVEVAVSMCKGMIGLNGWGGQFQQPALMVIAAGVALIRPPLYQRILTSPQLPYALAVGAGLGMTAIIFATGGGTPQNFIYFQF